MTKFIETSPLFFPSNQTEFEHSEKHIQHVLKTKLDINLTSKRANKLRDITAAFAGFENGYQQIKTYWNDNNKLPEDDTFKKIFLSAEKHNSDYISIMENQESIEVLIKVHGSYTTERIINKNKSGTLIKYLKEWLGKPTSFKEFIVNDNLYLLRLNAIDASNASGEAGRNFIVTIKKQRVYSGNEELNFDVEKIVNKISKFDKGLFLFSGVVNSGKSTTMKAVFSKLPTKTYANEEPESTSLPSESLLKIKEIMRKTPEVICFTEIRTKEQAFNAIEAVKKGVIIIATIHASNAVARLETMLGFDCTEYIGGVISQKMIRPKCKMCSAKGCIHCGNTGSRDRMPLIDLSFKDNIESTLKINHNGVLNAGLKEYKLGNISTKEMTRVFGNDFIKIN